MQQQQRRRRQRGGGVVHHCAVRFGPSLVQQLKLYSLHQAGLVFFADSAADGSIVRAFIGVALLTVSFLLCFHPCCSVTRPTDRGWGPVRHGLADNYDQLFCQLPELTVTTKQTGRADLCVSPLAAHLCTEEA